jgi:hypothetical protein
MDKNEGSAEEQIDFSFETIFFKFPKLVLDKMGNGDWYLNRLSWGFVNNRYYGINNANEGNPNIAMIKYANPPKPVLNKKNFEDIFFRINPEVKNLYPQYKEQIDKILLSIKEDLSD